MSEEFSRDGNQRGAPGGGGPRNRFDNKGAKVDFEIGVVFGDINYKVAPAASPAERFETALRLLDGNMARRASELIQEAVEKGYKSNKVAYYWTLSVLSGRPFERVKPAEYETLQNCFAMADSGKRDEWLKALAMIMQLMNCMTSQERGEIDDDDYDQIVLAFDELGKERREEIRRHLDLIMTGALQDQLDARYAAEIRQNRMSDDRERRAWKFFEPNPEPPRLEEFDEPEAGTGSQVAAAIGTGIAGVGLLLALVLSLPHAPLLALVFAAGVGAGGYVLATTGRSWLLARERIAADDERHGGYSTSRAKYEARLHGNIIMATTQGNGAPARPSPGTRTGARPGSTAAATSRRYRVDSPGEWTRDDEDRKFGDDDAADEEWWEEKNQRKLFNLTLDAYIDYLFAAEGSRTSLNRRAEWRADSADFRMVLADRLRRQYADSGTDANRLKWLIAWHAKQAKKRWDGNMLRADREELQAAAPPGALVALGVLVAAAGFVCGMVGVFGWNVRFGLIALAATAVGGWIVYLSRFESYLVRRDFYHAESEMAQKRHTEEKTEFDRWTRVLADRPSDELMARWLDYDKLFIKNELMQELSLANRDIVTHAILTEAQHPCLKARVLFGPPRYSDYLVTVILLNENGVRKIGKSLNFLNGEMGIIEGGRFFQYGSISSAEMVKVEVKFKGKNRQVTAIGDDDGEDGATADDEAQRSLGRPGRPQPSSSARAGRGSDEGEGRESPLDRLRPGAQGPSDQRHGRRFHPGEPGPRFPGPRPGEGRGPVPDHDGHLRYGGGPPAPAGRGRGGRRLDRRAAPQAGSQAPGLQEEDGYGRPAARGTACLPADAAACLGHDARGRDRGPGHRGKSGRRADQGRDGTGPGRARLHQPAAAVELAGRRLAGSQPDHAGPARPRRQQGRRRSLVGRPARRGPGCGPRRPGGGRGLRVRSLDGRRRGR